MVEEAVEEAFQEAVQGDSLSWLGKVFCAVMYFLFVIDRMRCLKIVVDIRQILLSGFSSSL